VKAPIRVSRRLLAVAAVVFAMSLVSAGQGAVITYVGSVEGPQAINWLDPSVTKTYDVVAGDNIYGTNGAINFTQYGYYLTPGMNYVGSGAQYRNAGYALVDQLPLPSATLGLAGIAINTYQFQLSGTSNDYLGKLVRVGVMQDVLGAAENAADYGKTLRLTGPGGGDSGLISVRGGGAGNGVPEMYFFDIYGVNGGDVITISAPNGPGQSGYVGPVSVDIGAVPEPGTFVMLGLGALGLVGHLWRRRRN
jgi:hypothetical protein